jgi:protein-disulfide isomerase
MTDKKQTISTGTGIIIAGFVIAIAILVSLGGNSPAVQNQAAAGSVLNEITEKDHVYGDPEAPITIIEYSDFQCPFCARFHPTMEEIVAKNSDVKWVYRHWPLGNHPEAVPSAIASECVAELGGNDSFWAFAKYAFENQRSLGDELYMSFVENSDLDKDAYTTCYEEGRYMDKVQQDYLDGDLSGITGTPGSVLVSANGSSLNFSGALDFDTVQSLIERVR